MSYRRPLSPSESLFAAGRSTVAYSVIGDGVLKTDCLTRAFAVLLRRYPVLSGRIVWDGSGYHLAPGPGTRSLRLSTQVDQPPTGAAAVLTPDEVCAVSVGECDNRFRLTLLVHHSIADAPAALRYLQVLCEIYCRVVETGSPGEDSAHPLPQSVEQVLIDRGFSIPVSAPPPAPPRPAADDSSTTARMGRTRLNREQTAGLFAAANRHCLTVHGIACTAIVLAAQQVTGATTHTVSSSVDLRSRVNPPLRAADGTVIQGADHAVVDAAGDPWSIGREVLASLSAGLANHAVHQIFPSGAGLRPPELNPLLVSNWGRIPPLRFPADISAHDFRASAAGVGGTQTHTSPPAFFVSTFAGRLGIDHPLWVVDDGDPSAAWNAALHRAFDRLLQ